VANAVTLPSNQKTPPPAYSFFLMFLDLPADTLQFAEDFLEDFAEFDADLEPNCDFANVFTVFSCWMLS
jgi:hypothetical protein